MTKKLDYLFGKGFGGAITNPKKIKCSKKKCSKKRK
jgi:hypothetical protein